MTDKIEAEIAELEQKVRQACAAINKANARAAKYYALAQQYSKKAERTREQHLNTANRRLRNLMLSRSWAMETQ